MEKDIGRIPKGQDTEIVIRIDDFGGKTGLTIREFVTSERYTGFTKAGTRIPADKFKDFKTMINSINEGELQSAALNQAQSKLDSATEKAPKKAAKKKAEEEEADEEITEDEEEMKKAPEEDEE